MAKQEKKYQGLSVFNKGNMFFSTPPQKKLKKKHHQKKEKRGDMGIYYAKYG